MAARWIKGSSPLHTPTVLPASSALQTVPGGLCRDSSPVGTAAKGQHSQGCSTWTGCLQSTQHPDISFSIPSWKYIAEKQKSRLPLTPSFPPLCEIVGHSDSPTYNGAQEVHLQCVHGLDVHLPCCSPLIIEHFFFLTLIIQVLTGNHLKAAQKDRITVLLALLQASLQPSDSRQPTPLTMEIRKRSEDEICWRYSGFRCRSLSM